MSTRSRFPSLVLSWLAVAAVSAGVVWLAAFRPIEEPAQTDARESSYALSRSEFADERPVEVTVAPAPKAFSTLYHELQAARIQGFTWDRDTYRAQDSDEEIVVRLDEQTYQKLLARYKDLGQDSDDDGDGGGGSSVPFDINTHITHIDTARIDAQYLNDKFQKYLKARRDDWSADQLAELLEEVHSSFALLSREDQVFANLWLHDVKSGDAVLDDTKTVHDYINDYKQTHLDKQIAQVAAATGVDADQLRALVEASPTDRTIDEYGRFGRLMDSVDIERAKKYLEHRDGKPMSTFGVKVKTNNLLRDFVLKSELPEDLAVSTEIQSFHSGQLDKQLDS